MRFPTNQDLIRTDLNVKMLLEAALANGGFPQWLKMTWSSSVTGSVCVVKDVYVDYQPPLMGDDSVLWLRVSDTKPDGGTAGLLGGRVVFGVLYRADAGGAYVLRSPVISDYFTDDNNALAGLRGLRIEVPL